MLITTPLAANNTLRLAITKAYRMDETECLNKLLAEAKLPSTQLVSVHDIAIQMVKETREYKKKQGSIDTLLQQYDLSTEEGIALMCMAEALLRIPDNATIDRFISDKLSTVDWTNHLSKENPLFINAATYSLLLTGKIYAPALDSEKKLYSSLTRAASKIGTTMIRPVIMQMMKTIGKQFVMGENIKDALTRAQKVETLGYRYSYDMLGEAARTSKEAKHYYDSYVNAIDAIGQAAKSATPATNPGISVKLSALHPRYEFGQRDRVMAELPPLLLALAKQAKQYNIGFTVDAEEADRLDLSLDIFEKVFSDPALSGWEGFGLAVQAYQKRASFVLDWLIDLSKKHSKRIMVRLVKGAYWDAEIKISQVQGFSGYPVFTRKNSTDVSYLACAQKMLAHQSCFFSQFGTHNAYSISAIMQMAKNNDNTDFEFQCLHGMGRPVYDQVVDSAKFNVPCRIYAPVGTHRDLLGYLVRRLLENGANSSFLNVLADDSTPVEKLVFDPVTRIEALSSKPHPRIPLPKDIYGAWQNSAGIDLSDSITLATLKEQMDTVAATTHSAAPIINGKVLDSKNPQPVKAPSNLQLLVGQVTEATAEDVESALQAATKGVKNWGTVAVEERARILEKAADLFQQAMPELSTILSLEAGKCIPDCIAEVRETIDFCRYYAYRARLDLVPTALPGPTGEENSIALHPRGVITTISPWNFPLAIFAGQTVAALAAGNVVIAKPAEQTPLSAFRAVQILLEAGIPAEALHLLPGQGSVVGAKLVNDPRVAGVMFTGSTETAKIIEKSLANREGPIAFLIAETGGQNAMIVDSSALAEQAVYDIALSAFNSAGQRCSALRVLFVQEEMAPKLLTMLEGYMAELTMGNPALLATDIGPVIDHDALQMLQAHFAKMNQEGEMLAQVKNTSTTNGYFFAPCAFELSDLSKLKREVFGPILHVIRYKENELDKVMDSIANTGYGLTLGLHSRIDATVRYISNRMPVGNIYVNRNMIGAVVGVQPFGGERLSGTGPKAGGPHYLPRLCVERAISANTTAVGGNARLISLHEDD